MRNFFESFYTNCQLKIVVEMGKTAILVMGPAGSGKSTFCKTIQQHCQSIKRSIHLVNLDPAAEEFEFKPSIDIRDFVLLSQVMEELEFGPNGGLMYCLESLIENIDWLESQLENYEEDHVIIDCPGQIELYTHGNIMNTIVETFTRMEYRVCGVYLLDYQFILDTPKFFAGIMSATCAMLQLGIPHINVMSKIDLLDDPHSEAMERFYNVDSSLLLERANKETNSKFHLLNQALVHLVFFFVM
jgi:GTPase SAR1 family protein